MLEALLTGGSLLFGLIAGACALFVRFGFRLPERKPKDAITDLYSWKRQRRRDERVEWERQWALLTPPENDPTLVLCDICGKWKREGLPADTHRESHL